MKTMMLELKTSGYKIYSFCCINSNGINNIIYIETK